MKKLEGRWDEVYIRPLGRGMVLVGQKEHYIEGWVAAALDPAMISPSGGVGLRKVHILVEWEEVERR